MKNLILIILCLLNIDTNAQSKTNSIYVEAGGNGIIYSINYDKTFNLSNKFKLAPRIGFEYYPHEKNSFYNDIVIPLEINVLISKNQISKNFFETGLGISFFSAKKGYSIDANNKIIDNGNGMAKVTTARLGFRHQKPEGGLMYRVGILVKISQDEFSKSRVGDDLFYRLWPGFSIGYSF